MLIPIWTLWTLALIAFLILLLLSTIQEFKKPKDACPQRILEAPTIPTLRSGDRKTQGFWRILVDIESIESTELEITATSFTDYLEALPNIEV